MHYFKFNIGDYHKKAGRLSMLEHGAYTLLIHSCYDRERFPTLEDALSWCWARSEEEVAAVKFVLKQFFTLKDGVYVQPRIEDEIAKYQEKSAKNRAIAEEREARKRTNRAQVVQDREPSDQDREPNQEPRTKNQEPVTKNQIKEEIYISDVKKPDDVSEQLWSDFLRVRETKRNRLTQTAFTALRSEAQKAGMTLEEVLLYIVPKGWSSFEVEYLKGFVPKEEPRKRAI